MTRAERTEFVVVGGGLLGLAAARALHRRGREVVVLEQSTVGHRRGGSYGPSRIFRLGYSDPIYVRMALTALDLWGELEGEAGETLLDTTGQVSFGADLQALFDAMTGAGAPAIWMSAVDVRATFPDIAVDGPAVFEPASGVLAADKCLAALRASAGHDVREDQRVTRVVDDGTHVTVDTDATTLRADVAIISPGPWSASVLSELAPVNTFATLEHVAYVRHRDGALPQMPVFIAHDRPAVYGLPTRSLGLYKVALHHAGAAVDPDAPTMAVDPEAVGRIEAATRRWLPTFEPKAELVETCLYDNTPDEHFILDRRERIVVGAGTSGHGFKFGPLLGELLADLATGTAPQFPLGTFSLSRSALVPA
jgi:sarcosine oxidase